MLFRRPTLPETQIHYLLSNARRQHTLRYLGSTPGTVTVRELSEAVAEAETGQSPAPRDVRANVYISLHQNHLPALQGQGIIEYDRERRAVVPLEKAREVRVYMEVVTRYGITWSDYYRNLGVLSLFVVVASLVDVPVFVAIDPILWASGSLVLFGLSTAVQLWKVRYSLLRRFRQNRGRG